MPSQNRFIMLFQKIHRRNVKASTTLSPIGAFDRANSFWLGLIINSKIIFLQENMTRTYHHDFG